MSNLTQPRTLVYCRVLLCITFLLTLPALNGVFISAQMANASEISQSNWAILIGLVIFLGVVVLILFGLTWLPRTDHFLRWLEFPAWSRLFWLIPAFGLLILI